jgi:hypothetical protein
MAIRSQGNLGELLSVALEKLKQSERFDEYLKYLNEEWYFTVEDLRLAREDEKIWFALKLPSRLKLELSALLEQSIAADSKHGDPGAQESNSLAAQTSHGDAVSGSWVKCWAADYDCYYYYNTITEESRWDDPNEGDGTMYDVYQYSEAEQKWIVVEEASQASTEDSTPLSKLAPAKGISPMRNESKRGDHKGSGPYDHKLTVGTHIDSLSGSVTSGGGGQFTKPRATPRAATGDDVLFVRSPNRPQFAKGGDHKPAYKYSTVGRDSPGRGPSAADVANAGEADSSSAAASPSRAARDRGRAKPVRINKYAVSSDDSGSSDDNKGSARSLRSKNGTANHNKTETAAEGEVKRHSPLHSKPLGRPNTGTVSGSPDRKKHSQRLAGAGLGAKNTAEEPKLEFRRHPSHMYDWDSKQQPAEETEDTAALHSESVKEEPYDFYRDYDNTEAEYVATEPTLGGAYAEGSYPYTEEADASGAGAEGGYDAHYGYDYGEGYGGQGYTEEGYPAEGYTERQQAGGDGYTYDAYYDGGYDEHGYYEEGHEAAEHEQWAAEEQDEGEEEPSSANDSDERSPSPQGRDPRWDSNRLSQRPGAVALGPGHADVALSKVDRLASQRATEHSYYHHLAEPSAPPAHPDARLPRFSPGKLSSAAGSKQYARHDPAALYDRYRDDKSDSPLLQGTPVSIGDGEGSPIAVPVTVGGARAEGDDDFYVVEATAAGSYTTPRDTDLMAMAMGSPGSNATPPVARKSKKNKITKLFRLNIFGKGPALPSTPPPPRDNSRDADRGHSANPHSSAYRLAKQLERKSGRSSNGTSAPHQSSSGGRGSSPRAEPAAEAPSRRSNRDSDVQVRRKPAPATAGSAEALAAEERYHAAHLSGLPHQQQHHSSSHGRGPPYASKEREMHYRNLQKLMDMGFAESESILALDMCEDSLSDATQMLLEGRSH